MMPSHQLAVTGASASTSMNMNVSMVVRPTIVHSNNYNGKFTATINTDESPLDLTLRKCNEKFVEKR